MKDFDNDDKKNQTSVDEYIQANCRGDTEAVERLYQSSGAQTKQEELIAQAPELYSKDMNYVYEPYWSYNAAQLCEYGKRIVQQIQPCFVDPHSVDASKKIISTNGEPVPVRKVSEFGRVMPLLYLQDRLANDKNTQLAVPRIFIIPNTDDDIQFDFVMPAAEANQKLSRDTGHNHLQVKSKSFTIYQEFIEGNSIENDQSFLLYGHLDFNAKQIVTSDRDHKKYLIDTKDQKNFFIPPLHPINDSYYTFWPMRVGAILPTNKDEFEQWQETHRDHILQAKSLHYPREMKIITINIGKIDSLNLDETLAHKHNVVFDESTPYFNVPTLDLQRYLFLQKYDLFLNGLKESTDVSLTDLFLPNLFKGYNSLMEMLLSAASKAYFNNNQAELDTLSDILKLVVQKIESTNENEQERFLSLLMSNQNADVTNKLTFNLDIDFLEQMLQKQEKPSEHLLMKAITYRDRDILNVILKTTNDATIESALRMLLSPGASKTLKEIPENERIKIANDLLCKLNKVSDDTIKCIFEFRNRELIETLLDHDFNHGAALILIANIADEPSMSRFRTLAGNQTNTNWHWFNVAERILTKQPSTQSIDHAAAVALNNGKITLLEIILKDLPKNSPKTDTIMKNLIQGPYQGSSIFENAISSKKHKVVDLFLSHGRPVSLSEFKQALRTNDSKLINMIIQSNCLSEPNQALLEAINIENLGAIKLLANSPNNISGDSIYNAISSKKMAIVDALKESLPPGAEVMSQYQINELLKDKECAQILVESKIDKDKALLAAIAKVQEPTLSQFRFLSDDKELLGSFYNELVEAILRNQPSSDAIDMAIANALNNQKLEILELLLDKRPQPSPKADKMIKEIINSRQYQCVSLFESAIKTNNMAVVEYMLQNGKQVSHAERRLAFHPEMSQLLDAAKSEQKIIINSPKKPY